MNELQDFWNDNFGLVRATEVDDKPYFVGRDVAYILGYQNTAIDQYIDWESSAKTLTFDNQGIPHMYHLIDESGINSLVTESNMPTAKQFKQWITAEVLPRIGKIEPFKMQVPKTYVETLRQLADATEKCAALQHQLATKIAQLNELKNWYSIKRWAKENRMNRRKISERALKAISMEHGFEVKKIFDGNYGEVNLYHRKAFAILFGK